MGENSGERRSWPLEPDAHPRFPAYRPGSLAFTEASAACPVHEVVGTHTSLALESPVSPALLRPWGAASQANGGARGLGALWLLLIPNPLGNFSSII